MVSDGNRFFQPLINWYNKLRNRNPDPPGQVPRDSSRAKLTQDKTPDAEAVPPLPKKSPSPKKRLTKWWKRTSDRKKDKAQYALEGNSIDDQETSQSSSSAGATGTVSTNPGGGTVVAVDIEPVSTASDLTEPVEEANEVFAADYLAEEVPGELVQVTSEPTNVPVEPLKVSTEAVAASIEPVPVASNPVEEAGAPVKEVSKPESVQLEVASEPAEEAAKALEASTGPIKVTSDTADPEEVSTEHESDDESMEDKSTLL